MNSTRLLVVRSRCGDSNYGEIIGLLGPLFANRSKKWRLRPILLLCELPEVLGESVRYSRLDLNIFLCVPIFVESVSSVIDRRVSIRQDRTRSRRIVWSPNQQSIGDQTKPLSCPHEWGVQRLSAFLGLLELSNFPCSARPNASSEQGPV
jgi:hypothetical protein